MVKFNVINSKGQIVDQDLILGNSGSLTISDDKGEFLRIKPLTRNHYEIRILRDDSLNEAVPLSNTHGLERTSPKGEKFIGRYIYCGREGLSSSAALEPCPKAPHQDQQILDAIKGPKL